SARELHGNAPPRAALDMNMGCQQVPPKVHDPSYNLRAAPGRTLLCLAVPTAARVGLSTASVVLIGSDRRGTSRVRSRTGRDLGGTSRFRQNPLSQAPAVTLGSRARFRRMPRAVLGIVH